MSTKYRTKTINFWPLKNSVPGQRASESEWQVVEARVVVEGEPERPADARARQGQGGQVVGARVHVLQPGHPRQQEVGKLLEKGRSELIVNLKLMIIQMVLIGFEIQIFANVIFLTNNDYSNVF